MNKILIINGPNINMLGQREKDIYGDASYEELNEKLKENAGKLGMELDIFQSNHEGGIVDRIQTAADEYPLIILNAGAFTHTSIAIRDALLAVDIPFIEVHISNVFSREEFRQVSYLSDIAEGVIAGFGAYSYFLALDAASGFFASTEEQG